MKAKLLQNYKINMMRDLVCSSAGRDVIILYAYISYLILYPISIYMWDFTAGALIAPASNIYDTVRYRRFEAIKLTFATTASLWCDIAVKKMLSVNRP